MKPRERLNIRELFWDPDDDENGNVQHIWREHEIYAWQVEDVVFDCPGAWVGKDKNLYPGHRAIIGEDCGGATLIVFIRPINKGLGIWKCETARRAEKDEKRLYRQNKGGA